MDHVVVIQSKCCDNMAWNEWKSHKVGYPPASRTQLVDMKGFLGCLDNLSKTATVSTPIWKKKRKCQFIAYSLELTIFYRYIGSQSAGDISYPFGRPDYVAIYRRHLADLNPRVDFWIFCMGEVIYIPQKFVTFESSCILQTSPHCKFWKYTAYWNILPIYQGWLHLLGSCFSGGCYP